MDNVTRPADRLLTAISTTQEAAQQLRRPRRIRPSELGKSCLRSVYYSWRWFSPLERFDARRLRIFETGKREEPRMLDALESARWAIRRTDPDDHREQIAVTALDGHLRGYLDGIGRDEFVGGPWHVIEAKTHKAASFRSLVKKGVRHAHEAHYAQLQIYMRLTGLKHGLYIAKNKDDDDLYVEFTPYNEAFADVLLMHAQTLRHSSEPPGRIGRSAEHHICKLCQHAPVCHSSQAPERNCRTCFFSSPIEEGMWRCRLHSRVLTIWQQESGCDDYAVLPPS